MPFMLSFAHMWVELLVLLSYLACVTVNEQHGEMVVKLKKLLFLYYLKKNSGLENAGFKAENLTFLGVGKFFSLKEYCVLYMVNTFI